METLNNYFRIRSKVQKKGIFNLYYPERERGEESAHVCMYRHAGYFGNYSEVVTDHVPSIASGNYKSWLRDRREALRKLSL